MTLCPAGRCNGTSARRSGNLLNAAMRDATVLAIVSIKGGVFETIEGSEEELREFQRLRKWYVAEWAETEKMADLQF